MKIDVAEILTWAVVSICIFILLSIPAMIIDRSFCKHGQLIAVVIDKQYKSESSNIGYVSKGGVIFTHEDEEFLLIVKQNKIVTAECKSELYYNKKIGQYVYCVVYRGCLSNLVYKIEAIK